MTAPNRDKILNFAANYLHIEGFRDYGPQGAQVLGHEYVYKIACGVSVNQELITRAKGHGCQMLLTHHGIYWNGEARDESRTLALISALEANNLTLASYHLPLDANKNIGNNVSMLKHLGFVKDIEPFEDLGWGGTCFGNVFVDDIRNKIPDNSIVFPFGPAKVNNAAVITGRAGKYLPEAAKQGYDLFLTGEAEEQSVYLAKEYAINFIAAGHHWTERYGIMNLTKKIAKKFNLQWEFIDVHNPV